MHRGVIVEVAELPTAHVEPDQSLAGLLAQIEECDQDYDRRYPLVLDAVAAAQHIGYAAGFRVDRDVPEWPVAYIELPTGQVSWHLPQHPVPWDKHTAEQKYRRVQAYINAHELVVKDVVALRDAHIRFTFVPVRIARTWRVKLAFWFMRVATRLGAFVSGVGFYAEEGRNELADSVHNVGESL